MARDALYDSVLVDPLSTPVAKVIKKEKEDRGPSAQDAEENMVSRIVNVLTSRANAYKERGDDADKNGATVVAKTFITVASELAFVSGKLKSGQIKTLEAAGK